MNNIRSVISQFIASIMEKDYKSAQSNLDTIVTEKVKTRIKETVEKQSGKKIVDKKPTKKVVKKDTKEKKVLKKGIKKSK